MKRFMQYLTIGCVAPFLIACSESFNYVGAYEILMTSEEAPDGEYKGVMVIEENMIWADGEKAEVESWTFEDDTLTAKNGRGWPVMTFEVHYDPTQLRQNYSDGTGVILRKFDL